ncbi:MAG: GNAT family N-acetyltransferase [Leucobacter sp.]
MTHSKVARPDLHGTLVTLRAPAEEDLDPLLVILREPEVVHWWVGYDAARVRREFIEDPDATRVIEVDGQCAGGMMVQRSDDPEYRTTVMHIFISTAFRGRRIGEEALALAIGREFAEGVSRVTLDPNVNNTGAIRSYERLGFKPVGVMRDYQERAGSEPEDALLLDMTRRDFPEGPPLPSR